MKTENLVKIMLGVTGLIFLLTAAAIAAIFIFPNKNVPERQIFVPHEAGQVKNQDQTDVAAETPELIDEETVMENMDDVSILEECHAPTRDEIVYFVDVLTPSSSLPFIDYKNVEPLQVCNLTNDKQVVVYSYEKLIFLTTLYVKQKAINIVGKDYKTDDNHFNEFLCQELSLDDVTSDRIIGHCTANIQGESRDVNFSMDYEYHDWDGVGLPSYDTDRYYRPSWETIDFTNDEVAVKSPSIIYCSTRSNDEERFEKIFNHAFGYYYYCQLSNGNKLLALYGGDHGDYGYGYHYLAELNVFGDVVNLSQPLQCPRHSELLDVKGLEDGVITTSCGWGDGPCTNTTVHKLKLNSLDLVDTIKKQYCDTEHFN
ncbi:hypothetical protein GF391_04010 [Candidatus Uhrbacteria bacterium]|nr:hypothetical protein [Candidatus Uhrbacteria bacterium]